MLTRERAVALVALTLAAASIATLAHAQSPLGIGSAAQRHIGDLLEMHEKNMLATQDIQRRKKLADDAFARRFQSVMDKHNTANYVKS